MLERILFLLASVTTLIGCTSPDAPEIRALCLRDDIGNYIIKWETDPQIKGTMKMYVSDNPNNFDTSRPVGYVNIREGVTTYITNDNIMRKYFLLSFNDRYYQTIGARSIAMDSVQNLRDIGGYLNDLKHMTHWGEVFRSGQLTSLTERDSIRLDNLGIKTIIDLRTLEESEVSPILYTKANIIQIPVSSGNLKEVIARLNAKRIRKGDGIVYMQDLYLQFLTNNSEQYAKAMEQFLDKDNYPILFNCSIGKDRSGFLAAMLLASLGVPEEFIMKDYMASNDYIRLDNLAYLANMLDTDGQEAITVLLSANENFLGLVLQKIKTDYGSIDKYLTKGLHFPEKRRNQLKDIMLY